MLTSIRDQVIKIWMIVYDGDADKIYSFTSFEKAIASIEGSVRGYFGEDDQLDIICAQVIERMQELKDAPCIPMKFNNLQVVVYNWELDDSNPVHKVLAACHDKIEDEDLRKQIANLFVPSIRN